MILFQVWIFGKIFGCCSVSAILVFEKGERGEIVKSKDLSDLSERYITKIAAATQYTKLGKDLPKCAAVAFQ